MLETIAILITAAIGIRLFGRLALRLVRWFGLAIIAISIGAIFRGLHHEQPLGAVLGLSFGALLWLTPLAFEHILDSTHRRLR